MFWLIIDPGWVLYAHAVDAVIAVPRTGSITRVLYPGWAQLFPCSLVFSAENYLRAFSIWAEFAKGVLGVPTFPVGPMDCALYLQFLLQ